MRALVVFESMFGDTKEVADAVAFGLASGMKVQIKEAGIAPDVVDDSVDVLVVGGPTHAFGLSRPGTREDAAKQAAGAGVISDRLGLREWLAGVTLHPGLQVAAFDTRVNKPRLPGSAAHAAERRLRRLGCTIFAPAESFYVAGTKGPLMDGELDRAADWGRRLATRVPQPGTAN
ncbi:MAG TPA: flavodoxin [Nakamurella sp.]